MANMSPTIGKILYGILFTVILPIALWLWAKALEPQIALPQVHNPILGSSLAVLGATIMLLGMASLWMIGGGLPMNAFPPPRYVSSGIYSLVPHPIYGGFAILVVGISMLVGSAAGLWFISPVLAMGCAAITLGYELPDLVRRFGPEVCSSSTLSRDSSTAPSLRERCSLYVLLFIPWLLLYEAAIQAGIPRDAIIANFQFENTWPVLQWTEIVYATTYLVVGVAPLLATTSADLRKFTIRGWLAMAVAFPLFFTVPLVAPPRPFSPSGLAGRLLLWERGFDTPAAAFPSFHVLWAVLVAELCVSRWPRMRWFIRGWAAAIAVSCITTGMHALVDVFAGLIFGVMIIHSDACWSSLRNGTERIANSWHEWHLGSLRVINHGAYVGLAVWIGTVMIGTLLGPQHNLRVFYLCIAGLIGAGLWAQLVEGSSGLLRPYGFYGGALGIIIAAVFMGQPWLTLSAFATAAPVIQALGRLRCLVQGCCHGAPAPDWVGIRYVEPHTRVCKAHLSGVPVHPTQLYSILWNLPCALLLIRLWVVHAPLNVIGGSYLILNGVGRFVEEAYRGEPQTKIIWGLRLYQWIAIASVLTGVVITALRNIQTAPALNWNFAAVGFGLVAGLITWFAMGVDLPKSNRRFARLT